METQAIEKKLVYSVFKGQGWQSLASKLSHTPTTSSKAAHLRKVIKVIQKANEQIAKDFEESILEKYAVKNEDGSIKRPEGQPDGFDFPEDNVEERTKALEDFGKREVILTLEHRPLTPDTLSDIKLSASEIEMLGELFSEENGPGLPNNLHALK